jgi:hypothetical protein
MNSEASKKKVKESLCFKCLHFLYNLHEELIPLDKFYRDCLGKIAVACSLYDPRMPAMKKGRCKDFDVNT